MAKNGTAGKRKSKGFARAAASESMNRINFSVDSSLLSELGERLVGRPHIALAELVKNSYDADATNVILRFLPDRLEVLDNGHGMDFTEFQNFWMRIGTPHKQQLRTSRHFGRPMTGSKGVGRLAVQFLATQLEMRTVSGDSQTELLARINWNKAVRAGELTQAVALYKKIKPVTRFPANSSSGTAIILSGLKQGWTPEEIENVAREIWWLQPPFRSNPESASDAQRAFDIAVEGEDTEAAQRFEGRMRAFLDIWHARLVGKLEKPKSSKDMTAKVLLSLEFVSDTPMTTEYSLENCRLGAAEFEIRVFHLQHRQRHGIRVSEAREYLLQYGGIRVYDTGFHLPFYGNPQNDWLSVEIDHSHRLSRSKLLPPEFQVRDGMNFLPTQSRLLGIVHIDTAKEREIAAQQTEGKAEYLMISVTRDRLVDNRAYLNLQTMVRWALDFYAMQEAERALKQTQARRSVEPVRDKFVRVDQALERHKDDIPKPVYTALRAEVQGAISASDLAFEELKRQAGLLGTLATAGISALAYEHEAIKQLKLLEVVVEQVRAIAVSSQDARQELEVAIDGIMDWIVRARGTRALFSPMFNEESRGKRERFKARRLLEEVKRQVAVLTRGIEIDITGVETAVYLPPGTYAEWSALFQNVFLNAVNAMIDSETKQISVRSRERGREQAILIEDTGCGVDLSAADELFKPFIRKLKISPERQALGLGGSGLGLTIVRMIANSAECKVQFVKPGDGFSTSFQISWSEKADKA